MQINVLEYLDRTAARFPEKPAVVDEQVTYTYAELAHRARATAAEIARRTNARNAPIAVRMPKSADAIATFFGILASGNFYVPLDVRSPEERTRKILENLEPALVLTEMPAGNVDDTTAPLAPPGTIDTDPAYVIYTSGSTGTPKGVVIPHRGIIDYIDWAATAFAIDEHDVIGSQSPLFFDNSTLDLYACIATGATLVVIPEALFTFPQRLVEFIASRKITFVFWVPSALVHVANTGVLANTPLPDLENVLFAGEVMPNRQLNIWRDHLPHARFANLYGPTEITVDCTYYVVDRAFRDDEPLPIGFPCRNTDVLIIDDELCVRGSSLALGYWNDPEKTAAAFAQNPLNPHYPERIYRTGDLVRLNEHGEIVFLGRKDSQIKHLGYRIELGEVELACGAVTGVRNACTLYDGNEIWMIYEAASEIAPAAIRQDLARSLPKYMIPTKFRRIDELPKNANGKIDRLALAERLDESLRHA